MTEWLLNNRWSKKCKTLRKTFALQAHFFIRHVIFIRWGWQGVATGRKGKKRKHSLQLRLLAWHHITTDIIKEIKIRDSQSFAEILVVLLDLFICFSNWIQCHSKFRWLSLDVTGQTVSIALRRNEAFSWSEVLLKLKKSPFQLCTTLNQIIIAFMKLAKASLWYKEENTELTWKSRTFILTSNFQPSAQIPLKRRL